MASKRKHSTGSVRMMTATSRKGNKRVVRDIHVTFKSKPHTKISNKTIMHNTKGNKLRSKKGYTKKQYVGRKTKRRK